MVKFSKIIFATTIIIYLIISSVFIFITSPTWPFITISALILFIILIVFTFYSRVSRYQHKILTLETEEIRIKQHIDTLVKQKTQELEHLVQLTRQSEGQYREAFATAMQGMAILSLEGSFLNVNTALCDMLGYKEKDMLRTDLQCITPPEDYIPDRLHMEELIQGKTINFQTEKRLYHQEGMTAWVLQSMSMVRSNDGTPLHFAVQFIDITERRQAEDQLKKYSETLTVLLREVNHRVKNNLAALISMLHMEQNKAGETKNNAYHAFLNDLINRIQSLSTVHSMLSAQNWQPLEISDLCNQVIRAATHGSPPGKKVSIHIPPTNIHLNSNQSHHLTLVINELTTNSIKHALRDRDQVTIAVDITHTGDDVNISFRDDGPGFPKSLIEGDYSSANIGFELIRGIVNQSLDGELLLENQQGAMAQIRFQNEIEIK